MNTDIQNKINSTPSGQDFSALLKERASATKACTLLKILANEDRLLILCQLMQGSRSVGELAQSLGIRQPTLSQQLTVLREEQLVTTQRRGKYIFYTLASTKVSSIMLTLYELYCQNDEQESSVQDVSHSIEESP
ncbi:MAG: metalloregulator ArsR/SmtB family transcription factor [Nitrosomonas sp.]|nr:metalloregulator ArsR/SmtB family transcription factor [Nitrosomonas sp.]